KRSIVHMVIRYCTLTYMYQHIGPVLRDDGSADDLTGCRGEDELVGRLWRAQPVKTHMIVAVQRSLVSAFIGGRIAVVEKTSMVRCPGDTGKLAPGQRVLLFRSAVQVKHPDFLPVASPA